jgi:hypothetical protein
MSTSFRRIEKSFQEPANLSGADLLGRIELKPGTRFFGASKIAIGVSNTDVHTYKLSFTVTEDTDDLSSPLEHDVVLVSDILSFQFDGSAIVLGELRGQGNCGGHVLLISKSAPLAMFPALETREVSIFSE